MTQSGALVGTMEYMSPEQALAKNLDQRSDIFSLGLIFYELLTGQPPFAGGTTMETVRQVLEKEPRRPSAVKPGMDRDLETICLKCLEKRPEDRYASAAACADDLARLLIALADYEAPSGILVEADDGKPHGWTHREFARALGSAVGTRPAIISSPGALLRLAARADQLFRGPKAKLTIDRAAYFSHHNWVVEPKRACPPGLWKPEIDTLNGLRETADWYRAQGWL
jgi:serine/threonine protein kinase